jgi:hypothetical protein
VPRHPSPAPTPTSSDSPFEGFTPTPPPPSLFGDDIAAPTPAPPRHAPSLPLPPPGRPPLGRAAYPNAPAYGPGAAPDAWAPTPGGPPLNLRPPETIDFGSGAPQVVARRSGPPRLVVLIVLIAGAVGGAKLAQIVTRQDVAAMQRTLEASQTEEPTAPEPSPSPGAPAR